MKTHFSAFRHKIGFKYGLIWVKKFKVERLKMWKLTKLRKLSKLNWYIA